MSRDKALWYLSGFRDYGLKCWLLASIAKIFVLLGLMDELEAKEFGNWLINMYFFDNSRKMATIAVREVK
jgi:hypothetical protein